MTDDELTPQRVATLTAAVDIEASPPDGEPVATLCSVAVHGAAGRRAADRPVMRAPPGMAIEC
jgi:hypothetical protein